MHRTSGLASGDITTGTLTLRNGKAGKSAGFMISTDRSSCPTNTRSTSKGTSSSPYGKRSEHHFHDGQPGAAVVGGIPPPDADRGGRRFPDHRRVARADHDVVARTEHH